MHVVGIRKTPGLRAENSFPMPKTPCLLGLRCVSPKPKVALFIHPFHMLLLTMEESHIFFGCLTSR